MKFIYPEGATPLDRDEWDALLPKHITLQKELNEWEQSNILEAEKWAFGQRHSQILSMEFIQKLHKKCLVKHGNGPANSEKPLKILELYLMKFLKNFTNYVRIFKNN